MGEGGGGRENGFLWGTNKHPSFISFIPARLLISLFVYSVSTISIRTFHIKSLIWAKFGTTEQHTTLLNTCISPENCRNEDRIFVMAVSVHETV